MAPIHYLDEPFYDFAHAWRTIRKPRICWACNKLIEKGERALENLDSVPSWQSGPRYHKACAIARYKQNEVPGATVMSEFDFPD